MQLTTRTKKTGPASREARGTTTTATATTSTTIEEVTTASSTTGGRGSTTVEEAKVVTARATIGTSSTKAELFTKVETTRPRIIASAAGVHAETTTTLREEIAAGARQGTGARQEAAATGARDKGIFKRLIARSGL